VPGHIPTCIMCAHRAPPSAKRAPRSTALSPCGHSGPVHDPSFDTDTSQHPRTILLSMRTMLTHHKTHKMWLCACLRTEHLVSKKYTNPKRLAIEGRSAGGLLMGGVLNLRPDLFSAAIMVRGIPGDKQHRGLWLVVLVHGAHSAIMEKPSSGARMLVQSHLAGAALPRIVCCSMHGHRVYTGMRLILNLAAIGASDVCCSQNWCRSP